MNIPSEWQNKAKNKADEILNEFFESNPVRMPVPIQNVIEEYVTDVHFVTSFDPVFDEGVSGFARKDMDVGWIVAINGRECTERQRFSAAHELGHIVLITNQEDIVYCSTDKSSWTEKVCDLFAGHILMPEKFVRAYYQMYGIPFLEDIAKAFKVSKQVAEIQLGILGLPLKSGVAIPF